MAGSLQRPPFKIIPIYKCSSSSKHKSIIKLQKQRLLRIKGTRHNSGENSSNSSHINHQQLHQQLLQQLIYCQSLSLAKLLLLLRSPLSLLCYDSCRGTATKNEKSRHQNLTTPTTATIAIKYVQQQQHHQQQQQQQQKEQPHQYRKLPQQKLQILNKTFKSSKFRKNLLNRKKLQQKLQQLRETQASRKNQLQQK